MNQNHSEYAVQRWKSFELGEIRPIVRKQPTPTYPVFHPVDYDAASGLFGRLTWGCWLFAQIMTAWHGKFLHPSKLCLSMCFQFLTRRLFRSMKLIGKEINIIISEERGICERIFNYLSMNSGSFYLHTRVPCYATVSRSFLSSVGSRARNRRCVRWLGSFGSSCSRANWRGADVEPNDWMDFSQKCEQIRPSSFGPVN